MVYSPSLKSQPSHPSGSWTIHSKNNKKFSFVELIISSFDANQRVFLSYTFNKNFWKFLNYAEILRNITVKLVKELIVFIKILTEIILLVVWDFYHSGTAILKWNTDIVNGRPFSMN